MKQFYYTYFVLWQKEREKRQKINFSPSQPSVLFMYSLYYGRLLILFCFCEFSICVCVPDFESCNFIITTKEIHGWQGKRNFLVRVFFGETIFREINNRTLEFLRGNYLSGKYFTVKLDLRGNFLYSQIILGKFL